MTNLLAAAIFFIAIHLFISGTRLRDWLAARCGLPAYLIGFSLLSALALGWLILAYLELRVPMPGDAEARYLAWLLNALAIVFVAFGVLGPSPTAVGGDRSLDRPEPATGLHRVTRHPMLWGVALWAATHMALNPQPVHLIFFGVFLILGLFGPWSIDRKLERRLGARWSAYAAVTSNVPGLALLQGRNRLVWSELLSWKLLVAAAVFGGFLAMHGRWFGVAVY